MTGNADKAAIVYCICDKWTRWRWQAQTNFTSSTKRRTCHLLGSV